MSERSIRAGVDCQTWKYYERQPNDRVVTRIMVAYLIVSEPCSELDALCAVGVSSLTIAHESSCYLLLLGLLAVHLRPELRPMAVSPMTTLIQHRWPSDCSPLIETRFLENMPIFDALVVSAVQVFFAHRGQIERCHYTEGG